MAGDDDFLEDDGLDVESDDGDSESQVQLSPKERADARRKVEDRLEELRLKRIMEDYNFDF